jgi:hypothetical protein
MYVACRFPHINTMWFSCHGWSSSWYSRLLLHIRYLEALKMWPIPTTGLRVEHGWFEELWMFGTIDVMFGPTLQCI